MPFLELERTGGLIGWNERLKVASDGSWIVSSRGDGRELSRGTFDSATMDALQRALDQVPRSANGRYEARGADFINLRLSRSVGDASILLVEGPWLVGQGGIPGDWKPVFDLLSPTLDAARLGR